MPVVPALGRLRQENCLNLGAEARMSNRTNKTLTTTTRTTTKTLGFGD
jgi:hypothetical protein